MEIFGITEESILELLRPLYGFCDAGDYWGITIDGHAKNDLGMTPLDGDTSLYIKPNGEDVDGIMGNYIDDGAHGGNEEFQKHTEKTLSRFDSKHREWDEFEFFGTYLRSQEYGSFTVDQTSYCKKIKQCLVPDDATFQLFRSNRATFAWIGHTRPDMCCLINRAAQVTEATFSKDEIRELNKGIGAVCNSSDVCLKYLLLDKATLHMRVYTDASFCHKR